MSTPTTIAATTDASTRTTTTSWAAADGSRKYTAVARPPANKYRSHARRPLAAISPTALRRANAARQAAPTIGGSHRQTGIDPVHLEVSFRRPGYLPLGRPVALRPRLATGLPFSRALAIILATNVEGNALRGGVAALVAYP